MFLFVFLLSKVVVIFAALFARPLKHIWHGSTPQGERDLKSSCDGWSTSSSDFVGLSSSLLKNRLLGQERMGCHNAFAVLCIEATSHTIDRSRRGRRRRRDALIQDPNADRELTEEEFNIYLQNLDESDSDTENP